MKRCYALNCNSSIPRKMLMCAEHWYKVPADIQREVYRSFDAWNKHNQSVIDYAIAIEQARLAVAALEGVDPEIVESVRESIRHLEARKAA